MTENIVRDAEGAQKQLCDRRGVPVFAPEGGVCPRCGRNVYEVRGFVDVELAGTELLTGCPWCHVSFVE